MEWIALTSVSDLCVAQNKCELIHNVGGKQKNRHWQHSVTWTDLIRCNDEPIFNTLHTKSKLCDSKIMHRISNPIRKHCSTLLTQFVFSECVCVSQTYEFWSILRKKKKNKSPIKWYTVNFWEFLLRSHLSTFETVFFRIHCQSLWQSGWTLHISKLWHVNIFAFPIVCRTFHMQLSEWMCCGATLL